jgi:hypothetical protein
MKNMGDTHRLRNLEVHIRTSVPDIIASGRFSTINHDDQYALPESTSDPSYALPGHVSPRQVAALLTDPLRTIRKVRGEFKMTLTGDSIAPWNGISHTVRGMIQSDGRVPDYGPCSRYFAVFSQFWTIFPLDDVKVNRRYYDMGQALALSRVRGAVATFLAKHEEFVQLLKEYLSGDSVKTEPEGEIRRLR